MFDVVVERCVYTGGGGTLTTYTPSGKEKMRFTVYRYFTEMAVVDALTEKEAVDMATNEDDWDCVEDRVEVYTGDYILNELKVRCEND